MTGFPFFVSTAAALLGMALADMASAQCLDPDPDPLRTPIRDNRTPFNLTVENVTSAKGKIVVTLYGNDPERWLKPEGSLYIYTVPARAPVTRICLVLPGPNRYAVAVYHDRNGNGRIDRNFLGVPTEGGGLSGNPSLVGLVWPKLSPSLISVDRAGTARTIKLRAPPL